MINGFLTGDKVVLEDPKAKAFYDRSVFGKIIEDRLELSLEEAFYLMEKKKIRIIDSKKKPLDLQKLVKKAKKKFPNFWTKYSVFRDMRTRGYIVKTGLKYGADYRLYERGAKLGKSHAKWLLYCVSEKDAYNWQKFAAMNRVAHSVKKKLIIAIVDDESSITYYEIGWIRP
ncbi:MAG: tRNA-intron lyase [Nanoarchaeota archaeon]|nr:tRNA-intron lyase [Nanoarchaeota archaeon]